MAAAAIWKNSKWRYLGNSLTDCREIWHGESSHSLKLVISKIQDGGSRHFEKSKNRDISAAVSAISTKFGTVTQFGPLDRSDRYKFKI